VALRNEPEKTVKDLVEGKVRARSEGESAEMTALGLISPDGHPASPGPRIAGKIDLRRLVELFTSGPESVLRLGRGTLTPGAPGCTNEPE
jgi:hypothetical protein